ncbi:CsbD family protein [Streptomyces pactum]|uniref:CsbD family protein n=1 Tax=Streptomyces pactum TaxID=68249 RepID=A0ABS0NDU7_9ACTN|nr:CsbD family protein [Streptomyces pactum]MBH5333373.1 CsbD family protein [Streptomyces pactum]
MAAGEKARAKVEQAVGKAAQAAGRVTGSTKLVMKGRAAEALGNAREGKESLKKTGRR